ncbi:MAG: beta-1,6-N-acetylglucosaminyltransferase [Silicimonas sp.]|nr:beta-1,6-N-acetylglucosaminyltransferase [Silicimonas sp.]
MKPGFVMLAHEALDCAAQVAILLSEAGCPVHVHVDRRTRKAEFASFARSVRDLPGVTLAPRIACDWGTWSLVQASRDGAEALLAADPDLTHVALISGSCLPIKPIEEFKAFLAAHPGTDFIESVTIGDVPWTKGGLSEERFTLTFPFAWKRRRRLFDLWVSLQRRFGRRRRLPEGLSPHMGSQWWCLTRETLEIILEAPDRAALDRYFRRVWIPDEGYFQSLVRLYDRKVVSRSLTLSKFDFLGKPHIFYDDHLLMLRQSSAFFARKIWPGAHRLYRAFLHLKPPTNVAETAALIQVERTFSQAVIRRTRGRPGLIMAGRHPRPGFENGLTAAPYSVFHGFSDVFHGFEGWIARWTGARVHGHLFGPNGAEFHGAHREYAGALSAQAGLRDYDPEAFLRNLIWNTRGEHQSFLFAARDSQGVVPLLARDRNATIFVITGAWALPLLRDDLPIAEVRREAARNQKIEAAFLEQLRERQAQARVLVWSLLDFLERPAEHLQEVIDTLSPTEPHLVTELPAAKPMEGLGDFLQALRNAGMSPHLAGEAIDPPTWPGRGSRDDKHDQRQFLS